MSNVPGGPGQLFALPKAARTVLLPRFDAGACLAAIEDHRITHTVLVPTMLQDLLRHPDLTHRVLSSLRVMVMATIDDTGFVYIVDRKKDVIISGGTNVSSREIEEIVGKHPGIGQVAVVGLPDERWGEAVTAVVVPAAGVDAPTAEEIIAHCRANLGGPKVPKAVHFVDALPTNAMGKILKTEVRRNLSGTSG